MSYAVVCLLGRRICRPLVGPDRLASRGRRCLLVWLAGLDRARVQANQKRWLAMAIYTHGRSRTSRTAVAGGGRRYVVVVVRGRRGGCGVAGGDDGRGAAHAA